ncbi:MAG: phosphatidylglycerophosphatase A [Candidatus Aminicenantes bacterium]|nr:phosphatidylglycerophosphatase A [Candidatus Aminicenantes bacterium]
MINAIARGLATVFGAGYFPLAPGTLASLLAAVAFRFVLSGFHPLAYAGLVAGIFFLGVWASRRYARILRQKDPRRAVIDEIAGQLAALAAVPPTWPWIGAGFFLFRLFDVVKPFPVRRLERLPGGWGIMADDMLAGLYAALILQAWRWLR